MPTARFRTPSPCWNEIEAVSFCLQNQNPKCVKIWTATKDGRNSLQHGGEPCGFCVFARRLFTRFETVWKFRENNSWTGAQERRWGSESYKTGCSSVQRTKCLLDWQPPKTGEKLGCFDRNCGWRKTHFHKKIWILTTNCDAQQTMCVGSVSGITGHWKQISFLGSGSHVCKASASSFQNA